jgi:hypothetical protein
VTPLLATYTAAHGVALAPFSSFVDLLTEIEDPRRAEGKLYRLPHVVLFAILAIVAGATLIGQSTALSMFTSPGCAMRSA